MKRIYFLFAFIIVVVQSEQNGNLQVVQAPDYLLFDSKSPLKLTDFKNILLATNGFPIEKSVEWDGLKRTKTIEFPRATLLFVLNQNQTNDLKPQAITLIQDTDLDFDYLKQSTQNSDSAVEFYDTLPGENELKNFDCSALSSFHVFELSETVTENKIREITNKVSEKCSNDLISYLLLSDKPSRIKRQAVDDASMSAKVTNEAVFYSDQYPAMFNLIFWSSLILGLAIFGISYGMWNMDPGLDTVIYRMTSQRIKKDQ